MPDFSQMQNQLMQNPEMMQQMLNSPIMESLLSNPEALQSMMLSNPQLQPMLDANPQIRHILNDPALMRQTMEMMRNPHAMQQAMRQQDLAMSQLENLPGGFSALQRMYEEVQEPLMQASQQQQPQPQVSQPSRTSTLPNSSAAPNTSALPNPWGSAQRPPPQPWGTSPQGQAQAQGQGQGQQGLFGAPNPFSGLGGMGGLDPAMLSTMMQNPQLMQQMRQSPQVQQMMQNPQLMQQMLQNPQVQQMLQNPQIAEMLGGGETARRLLDPANMQAILQLQQSGLLPNLGGLGGPPNPFLQAPPPVVPGNSVGGLDFSALLGQTRNSAPVPPLPAALSGSPEVRYASQLQQLESMGFSDRAANIRALVATQGNVNAAVERLLS